MENKDISITEELIERAKANDHLEFYLITSVTELWSIRKYKKAMLKVLDGFAKTWEAVYNEYVSEVEQGKNNLNNILSLHEMNTIIDFYAEEIDIINSILEEYDCYLSYGHIWDLITKKERLDKDLFDHRCYYERSNNNE